MKQSLFIQEEIYKWALNNGNNIVTRGLTKSCHDLRILDSYTENKNRYKIEGNNKWSCYGCGKLISKTHGDYVFSCFRCGNKFQKLRNFYRDITGYVALVIGARTKLGHQVVIKLLDAGATVIGTTRYPDKALDLYKGYKNYNEWSSRLFFYPHKLDLDNNNLDLMCEDLASYIMDKFKSLDIMIISAAQTIRSKEKEHFFKIEENRYNDTKYVPNISVNSWNMTLYDIPQKEMEEVYRINCIAPTIITRHIIPLMKKSEYNPFIINVHAREGIFSVKKSDKHFHTNMAKAGLAMHTKNLTSMKLKTDKGLSFSIHGCDPGWISVDEYYEHDRPWIVPPLDEIDGASRIVYPIFKNYKQSQWKTRKHYDNLII